MLRYSQLIEFLENKGYVSRNSSGETWTNAFAPAVLPTSDTLLTGFAGLYEAEYGEVAWARGLDADWEWVNASVVFCPEGDLPDDETIVFIPVDNPRRVMIQVMRHFLPAKKPQIDQTAVIGDNVAIGGRARIGANVTIHDGVSIGDDIVIGSNCSIGDDGFGFERDGDKISRFPHVGTVRIGNGVELCNGVFIARGVLVDTVIEDNVKVDNKVHIAHNCHIGKETAITAGVTFGGSVHVGERCWFGLGSSINDGVTIGDDVIVGTGAVVMKDVDDGMVVVGNPARPIERKKHYHFKYNEVPC